MATRRAVITGGLSAAAVAAAAGGAALLRRPADAVETVGTVVPATPAPAPAAPPPTVTALGQPAAATTPADRIDTPLRIDWIGGSDIAWEAVSLPTGFAQRVPVFAERPIDMRTRMGRAVMADGALALVNDAVSAHTDAIILSINPVWLHWDEVSCQDVTAGHARYECLLTPIDPALTERRDAELRALVDAAVAAGVPLYVYTMPHSTESLANPLLQQRLAEAERAIAALDPGRPDVRVVARIFSRDLPPLREGVEFIDMVHPTPAGAETLADWLAIDIGQFWSSLDFGR